MVTAKTTAAKPAAKKSAPAGASFETALAALGRRADETAAKLAELKDDGAKAAGKQLDKASKAANVKLRELQKGWQKMEPKKRAQLVAGAFAALAAAVAVPVVVRRKRAAKVRKPPTKK